MQVELLESFRLSVTFVFAFSSSCDLIGLDFIASFSR